jgi:dihydrofolate reductase
MIKLSVAQTGTGLIGIKTNGQYTMPWRIPSDLKHFKMYTMGTTLVMGSNTWRSIGCRPLPGRRHIIHTRDPKALARESAEIRIENASDDNLIFADLFPDDILGLPNQEQGVAVVRRLAYVMQSTGRSYEDENVTIAGGSFIYEKFLELDLIDEIAMTLIVTPSEDEVVSRYWKEGPEPERQRLTPIPLDKFDKYNERSLNGEKDEYPANVFFYRKTD